MRIDFEDLEVFSKIHHKQFDMAIQDAHFENIEYFNKFEYEWATRSSPYHIFDIIWTRNAGLYEILYDYIKRRVDRGSTVFDYGAGVGTMEVLLLKRFPITLTIHEPNLLCENFIQWRLFKRGAELFPRLKRYNYVVSIDTLQRLPPEQHLDVLNWLMSLGDRLFLFVPKDTKHPLYSELAVDIEEHFKIHCKKVSYFHGLWDVVIRESEGEKDDN